MRSRLVLAAATVGVALASGSCSTANDPVALVSTFRVQVRDSSLQTQFSASPQLQVLSWQVDELSASLAGPEGTPPTFDFLGRGSCQIVDNVFARADLARQCGGNSGVILSVATPTQAIVRLVVSRMEGRYGLRPDLPLNGDFDGDGVANGIDTCKLVPNAEQNPVGIDFSACAILDETTQTPLFPDQDLDGVRDSVDNCAWISNPANELGGQLDTNRNAIGDACERVAPVVLPTASVAVACPVVTTGGNVGLTLDFGAISSSATAAVTCAPDLSFCSLDPENIQTIVFPAGSATLGACTVLP